MMQGLRATHLIVASVKRQLHHSPFEASYCDRRLVPKNVMFESSNRAPGNCHFGSQALNIGPYHAKLGINLIDSLFFGIIVQLQ